MTMKDMATGCDLLHLYIQYLLVGHIPRTAASSAIDDSGESQTESQQKKIHQDSDDDGKPERTNNTLIAALDTREIQPN